MAYETQQQPAPPAQPQAQAGGPSGPRAGFWQRFAAVLIDGIILAIPYGILAAVADPAVAYIVYLVGNLVYFTMLDGGPNGQTIGKKALNIRVYDINQGGPIGYGRGFIREIGKWVSSLVLLLGYFWMLWDPEKQTWHDKFANSVVVPTSDYPVR